MIGFHQTTTDDFSDVGEGGGKRLQGETWFRKDTGEVKMFNNGKIITLFDINGMPQILPIKKQKVIKTFADFAIADTTKQINLIVLPPAAEIITINAEVTTAWDGGATVTMSAGTVQSSNSLLLVQDVKSTGFKDGIGTRLTSGRGMFSSTDPVAIVAELKSTVFNLNASSQGQITFYYSWIEY